MYNCYYHEVPVGILQLQYSLLNIFDSSKGLQRKKKRYNRSSGYLKLVVYLEISKDFLSISHYCSIFTVARLFVLSSFSKAELNYRINSKRLALKISLSLHVLQI